MRTLSAFGLSLLLATGLSAQYQGGFVQRSFGNVVFPGGGGPRWVVPGAITDPTFGMRLAATVAGQNFRRQPLVHGPRRTGTVVMYGYPVYLGGYADYAYPVDPAQQPPPDVTVVYPPQPAPVIINYYGSDNGQDTTATTGAADTTPAAAATPQPVEEPASVNEPSHYLIAFKDHTIYSAVAYWVDGDTLHYFTSGDTHNQVSLSLIDRDLTLRLNRESGLDFRLP